jgi:hypothetical protein
MIQVGGRVLYDILIEFIFHVKLVTLITTWLNKYSNEVSAGKCLSYAFPIQNGLKLGDALLLRLLNIALECVVREVQEGLELNGTC